MSLTNFPNGISSFGIPVLGGGGIPASPGKFLFVDYGNGDDGRSVKSNSAERPFKTVEKAYSLATTNKDDVIVLVGNTTHTLTEMLTVSKNRVHFVGMDGTLRKYGQNAKIALGVTTAATNLGTVLNTGVRNSYSNIKFVNSDTLGTDLYTFLDGGEYMSMSFCEIYKESLLSTTGAAEMVMNGDSAQIVNCTIGSLANFQTGTTIRPGVLVTKATAGAGLVARDVSFIGCNFWKNAGHVNGRHVYGANATDVERLMMFEDCTFVNSVLAAAVPAQCVAFGASQTVGQVLIKNCTSINNTKLSTTTGVLIAGPVPTYATAGIAVAS
jgi:hypothetical protein